MNTSSEVRIQRVPWNKGRLIGHEAAPEAEGNLGHQDSIAISGEFERSRAIGCDLVSLKVNYVAQGGSIFCRAVVMQQQTHRPVQFEIREQTR